MFFTFFKKLELGFSTAVYIYIYMIIFELVFAFVGLLVWGVLYKYIHHPSAHGV